MPLLELENLFLSGFYKYFAPDGAESRSMASTINNFEEGFAQRMRRSQRKSKPKRKAKKQRPSARVPRPKNFHTKETKETKTE
jgi:hypothetical protein